MMRQRSLKNNARPGRWNGLSASSVHSALVHHAAMRDCGVEGGGGAGAAPAVPEGLQELLEGLEALLAWASVAACMEVVGGTMHRQSKDNN